MTMLEQAWTEVSRGPWPAEFRTEPELEAYLFLLYPEAIVRASIELGADSGSRFTRHRYTVRLGTGTFFVDYSHCPQAGVPHTFGVDFQAWRSFDLFWSIS